MTAHRLLALSAATGALAVAAPAWAQPNPSPDTTYEYGQTVPPGEVVFESVPVVQPVSGPAPQPVAGPPEQVTIYKVEAVDAAPPAPVPPAPPAPPAHYGHAYPAAPAAGYYPAQQPAFDREAWLDDCHERIRGVSRKDRAGVIGGLLGAVAGGVIGNRAWGSERLAGTLLGAGVGGLAGVAIGSAIGAASDRKREDECVYYLDRYMAGPHGGPSYAWGGYPAYGYGYAHLAVAYVPVLVQVPQRAVVREYVTEEWVDVPVATRTVTRTKIIRQPAPRPDKRTKLIKAK